jgi:hypothetical protein
MDKKQKEQFLDGLAFGVALAIVIVLAPFATFLQ